MCVLDWFILHVGHGDLSDRGEVVDGVEGVPGEVWSCAQVCVQEAPRDLQGVLSRFAEPLQDPQPSPSLNHTGNLQLHPRPQPTVHTWS